MFVILKNFLKRILPLIPYLLLAFIIGYGFMQYVSLVEDNESLRSQLRTTQAEVGALSASLERVEASYAHQKELEALRGTLTTKIQKNASEHNERLIEFTQKMKEIENENHPSNDLHPDVRRLLNEELESRGLK